MSKFAKSDVAVRTCVFAGIAGLLSDFGLGKH